MKYHRLRGFNNTSLFSHSSGGWKFEIRDHGHVLGSTLFLACRKLPSLCILPWPVRGVSLWREISLFLILRKPLIPHETLSSWLSLTLITSQRPFPNATTVGVRRFNEGIFSSVQFSSVAQSCPTLCDPMNCSMPGFPVHHQLPEFTQTHTHRVGDTIQLSHPLSSPFPPAPNPSQHQSLIAALK